MVKGIHHVSIAVRNLDQALEFYGGALGLQRSDSVAREEGGLRLAFLQAGESKIELMQPTDPEHSVARFLDRRGEGLHHICLEVGDVRAALQSLAERGAELIDREPRPGAAGQIAFIHPQSANGVLIELAQREDISVVG